MIVPHFYRSMIHAPCGRGYDIDTIIGWVCENALYCGWIGSGASYSRVNQPSWLQAFSL